MKNKEEFGVKGLRKTLVLMTALLALFLIACNDSTKENAEKEKNKEIEVENLTESGMPIVKEQITLDFFTGKSQVNLAKDWNDLTVWNKYQEMTNIKVNWVEQVSAETLAEKRNLALAGGNLPDVLYASRIPNVDLFTYGQQGTFIELNDLIDEHAPNLKAILDENPAIKNGLTFPNGKIYALPALWDEDFLSLRMDASPWMNKKWLDKLGMNVPETTEEFYTYLKAVKEQDLNENGKMDEIPYGGVGVDGIVGWLRGSFGLGNTGVGHVDKNPNGEGLRFIPTADEYKELLEFINKLYKEELIQSNIFSIEWDQFIAGGAEGKYGSTTFYDPAITFAGGSEEYIGASALKGPHGDQIYSTVISPLYQLGGFIITNKNQHPAASVRWMDYFYSDEGAKLLYMGIENETFEQTADGKYKYVDELANAENMNQAISEHLPWVGTGPPGIVKKDYFLGSETSPATLAAADKIAPFVPKELWPRFTYTGEENKFLTSKGVDIDKYVTEMRDKFISGDVSFKEWDNYVKTLEGIGIEKYLEIQEAAYERYLKN